MTSRGMKMTIFKMHRCGSSNVGCLNIGEQTLWFNTDDTDCKLVRSWFLCFRKAFILIAEINSNSTFYRCCYTLLDFIIIIAVPTATLTLLFIEKIQILMTKILSLTTEKLSSKTNILRICRRSTTILSCCMTHIPVVKIIISQL